MMTSYSNLAGELLKLLGIDPQRCTKADIILRVDTPVTVNATFEVHPMEIEDEKIKTIVKQFKLVEEVIDDVQNAD